MNDQRPGMIFFWFLEWACWLLPWMTWAVVWLTGVGLWLALGTLVLIWGSGTIMTLLCFRLAKDHGSPRAVLGRLLHGIFRQNRKG